MGRGGNGDDGKGLLYGRPAPIPRTRTARSALSEERAREIESFVLMLYRNTDALVEPDTAASDLLSDFHHWFDTRGQGDWDELITDDEGSLDPELVSEVGLRKFSQTKQALDNGELSHDRDRVLGKNAFDDTLQARRKRIDLDLSHTGLNPDRVIKLIRSWSESHGLSWGAVVSRAQFHYHQEIIESSEDEDGP
jgi:hypothetical protein